MLTDGSREIAIYPLATSHADDFQLIYLPREKILIEADHAAGARIRLGQRPWPMSLFQRIEQLKLDVATIAGIHGDTGDMQGLKAAVAKAGKK